MLLPRSNGDYIIAELDLSDGRIYPVWNDPTMRYADLNPNNYANNGAIEAFFGDGRVRLRTEHLDQSDGSTLAGFAIVKRQQSTVEH